MPCFGSFLLLMHTSKYSKFILSYRLLGKLHKSLLFVNFLLTHFLKWMSISSLCKVRIAFKSSMHCRPISQWLYLKLIMIDWSWLSISVYLLNQYQSWPHTHYLPNLPNELRCILYSLMMMKLGSFAQNLSTQWYAILMSFHSLK